MKRIPFIIGLLALLCVGAYATFINDIESKPNADWWSGATDSGRDTATLWAREVQDKLDGTSGMISLSNVEVFDANDTLTAAETGKVCVSIGFTGAAAGNMVLTLPGAAVGLNYWIYDANAVAADDLWITAGTGDTINGGTAAKSYKCTGDAVKQGIWLVAQDSTSWLVMSEVGSWSNDNN